jgi:hypothetical protein
MKNKLLQLIKIISLGVLLSLGVGYIFAETFTVPSSIPTGGNLFAPITSNNISQIKGNTTPDSYTFDVFGTLSSTNLAVFSSAVVTGTVMLPKWVGTGNRNICLNSSGVATTVGCVTLPIVQNYSIISIQTANGTISAGSSSIPSGTNYTFTLTPNSGYYVSAIAIDGAVSGATGNSYTFTNVVANHTIKPTFLVIPAVCGSGAWSYNGKCWRKEYRTTTSSGMSCNSTCAYYGTSCVPNTQDGTIDDVINAHFGNGTDQTLGNSQNILAVSGGSGYSRYGGGFIPETLTQSCSMTKPWWDYICSCNY